mgnify:FL=1
MAFNYRLHTNKIAFTIILREYYVLLLNKEKQKRYKRKSVHYIALSFVTFDYYLYKNHLKSDTTR